MDSPVLVRVAQVAAVVAAVGFAVQTVLFLVAAAGLLGSAADFTDTRAAQEIDYATYYAALFNHRHDIVWNVVLRGVIGPIAWVAVGILAVLTALLVRSVQVWIATLVVCLGAALAALADLVFATLVGFWRYGGWSNEVPTNMIAAGRAYEAVKTVSTYLQYDAFVVVAVGLIVLTRAGGWSSILRWLLGALAVALVSFAALDWVWPLWHASQWPRDLVALVLGLLLAPAATLTWARQLRRRTDAGRSDPGTN